MSDYSAVAPPTNFSQSSAFAAALQRARQIAAKINPTGSSDTVGQKRPLEEGSEPDAKKVAAVSDPQLAALRVQATSPSGSAVNSAAAAAAVQAAAVAARVAAAAAVSLGVPGAVQVEDIRVPDKMVGLIIGRGGEQITRLQNESRCKIQMAPDSNGQPERVCTLTGTREAIGRARELIMNIVQQRSRTEGIGSGGGGGDMGMSNNHAHVEIMVPGPKVGLIIGKGGETIKQLQEKSGAKMVVIQDGPAQEEEKPLRISGEPQKVEYAKQLVYDLIAEKEMQAFNRGGQRGGGGNPGYEEYGGAGGGAGGGGGDSVEVAVPRAAVGVVIGKGGDMIKKIQNETGARVQFQQGRDDGPGERRCLLTGKPNQVEQARRRIEELIESVMRRDNEIGRGRGRGGPGGGGGPPFDRMVSRGGGEYGNGGGGWDRRPGGMQQGGQMDKQEATFTIPASKCGIVIGRGGETIKQINQQTGAHCELDRRPPPNPAEKVFVIRGSPEQIEQAKRIISEKIGMPPGPGGAPPTQYPIGQGAPGGQGPPQHFAPQGWGGGYQHWQGQQHPNDPSMLSAMPCGGQVQVNPATGQPDYSIQWAEYYRSMGMIREAELIEQQAKANKGLAPQPAAQPQPQPTGPQPTAATQNGQPDYSAQWADYYRSIGKIKEAEAIEAQMKANKAGQPNAGGAPQQQQPQQPQQQPGGAPPQPGPGPQQPQQPQPPYGQPYGYQAAGYYGGAPGAPQPTQQPGPGQAQPYGYPNYGGYGAQPGGPENQ